MRFPVKTVLLLLWTICAAKDCNDAPPRKSTENLLGTWSSSVYPEGTRATYKCRPGYRTLGSIIMECKNGKWESLYPSRVCMRKPCGHPGDIQFGSFELVDETEFLFGARVVYKCNEGYQLVSAVNYRVCEAEGWSNDVPICEVIKCSPVTAPKNGRITTSSIDLDQEFTFGQVVRFDCNPGFMLKGPKEIYCSTDGDWDLQEPQCIEISCKAPSIENGKLSVAKSIYKENERLQYKCDQGFAVNERGDPICTKFGWTPDILCREVRCDPPHLPNGNIHHQKDDYRGDDEITYECKKGFSTPVTGNKAKCSSEGWLPQPRCILRPCDYPEIENGKVHVNYFQSEDYIKRTFQAFIGKEMHYHCKENFVSPTKIPSEYWTTIVCTTEGWSPEPKCIRQCKLHSIQNGHFSPNAGLFKEGDEVTVHCYGGYSLQNNEKKITCTKNGWSLEPKCEKIQMCTLVNNFENGFFTETKKNYEVGTVTKYQCKEGYATREGKKEGFIKCGQQGWLNQPLCIKICDIPKFDNAIIKGNKTYLMLNETLEYTCIDGYEITSGKTTDYKICGVDEWPTILECYEKTCQLPILHKALDPNIKQEKYKVGDVLTFQCSQGLKIAGPFSVQCYYFGWSPSLPMCKDNVEHCEQPPILMNGKAKEQNKTTYLHNDVVEYDCDLGFVRKGPKNIQCNDGKWTTLPTCIEEKNICAKAPELLHGHVHTTSLTYSHGMTVEYNCEESYTMIGSKTIACLHGNWTQLPICIETQCPSNFFEDLQVNLYKPFSNDNVIEYRCNGSSKIHKTRCKKGKWKPEPYCQQPKECAPPPQIPNAQNINTTVNYQNGEKIHVLCMENYLLQGQDEIICENGQWNSLPRCIEKQPCSKPPALQYGDIRSISNLETIGDNLEHSTYAHNTTVNYMCQEGFNMVGREEITCNMGKWSSPPHCVGIPCARPPPIHNGHITKELNSYEFGDEVTYACEEGFYIDGPATIKCSKGTWSEPPQCKDGRCKTPPKFNNADRISTSNRQLYYPGEKVKYQCLSDFQAEGSTEVTCIGGRWNGDPQCKDKSCVRPPPIENAEIMSRIKERYHPGEVVTYKCVWHLKMYGKPDVTCINKNWTELPECKEEVGKCGSPPPINNGDITSFPLSEYAPGSKVEYRCQQYYVLEGSPTVKCQNGIWTEVPVCLDACVISEEKMKENNIKLKWKKDTKLYSKAGDMIEFECKWYHRRHPYSLPFRTQCLEGKINYPTCI